MEYEIQPDALERLCDKYDLTEPHRTWAKALFADFAKTLNRQPIPTYFIDYEIEWDIDLRRAIAKELGVDSKGAVRDYWAFRKKFHSHPAAHIIDSYARLYLPFDDFIDLFGLKRQAYEFTLLSGDFLGNYRYYSPLYGSVEHYNELGEPIRIKQREHPCFPVFVCAYNETLARLAVYDLTQGYVSGDFDYELARIDLNIVERFAIDANIDAYVSAELRQGRPYVGRSTMVFDNTDFEPVPLPETKSIQSQRFDLLYDYIPTSMLLSSAQCVAQLDLLKELLECSDEANRIANEGDGYHMSFYVSVLSQYEEKLRVSQKQAATLYSIRRQLLQALHRMGIHDPVNPSALAKAKKQREAKKQSKAFVDMATNAWIRHDGQLKGVVDTLFHLLTPEEKDALMNQWIDE